jgi:hypothetical protein
MKPQPELRSRTPLGNATAQLDATGNATRAQPTTLKALAAGVLARNHERNWSATAGKKAATHAQHVAAAMDRPAPVVTLLLTLRHEDGALCEAILQIPKERYDGLLVLELFEKHLATSTKVVKVELSPTPEKMAGKGGTRPEVDLSTCYGENRKTD